MNHVFYLIVLKDSLYFPLDILRLDPLAKRPPSRQASPPLPEPVFTRNTCAELIRVSEIPPSYLAQSQHSLHMFNSQRREFYSYAGNMVSIASTSEDAVNGLDGLHKHISEESEFL